MILIQVSLKRTVILTDSFSSSSDDSMSTSTGSLVGGVLFPLDETGLVIMDLFAPPTFKAFDSGVKGSGKEDVGEESASDSDAIENGLVWGFAPLLLRVALDPLPNQDIKLFCFMFSLLGIALGAMRND